MIKISVICGIYFPPEALFRKFLDSCINQTLEDIEFLFFLDHPDDTLSRRILSEYEDKFSLNKNKFIIIENETNIGDIQTYKNSLSLAKGKYICFLDNDDFFDIDFLETMYKYIEKLNKQAVICNAIVHYYKRDVLYELLDDFTWDTWSFLYNKECFMKIYKENGEDFFKPMCKLHKKAGRIPLSEGVFYHYVRHDTNMSMYQINDEDLKNPHFNKYMEEYDYDFNTTRRRLKKRFHILEVSNKTMNKEDLETKLLTYSTLDEHLDNSMFDYERIKEI